ncbi:hypothetical protein EVAR_56784_1 [Eumeta japonica]|uniref:Uncharacterized protein n=1 Tax=Eumeta variegata TaxID=151549 RepID=A0A4C1Z1Y3_EUMVA|nr:hypothetical protein EVAR_56784_1 [Eumeta japonica]
MTGDLSRGATEHVAVPRTLAPPPDRADVKYSYRELAGQLLSLQLKRRLIKPPRAVIQSKIGVSTDSKIAMEKIFGGGDFGSTSTSLFWPNASCILSYLEKAYGGIKQSTEDYSTYSTSSGLIKALQSSSRGCSAHISTDLLDPCLYETFMRMAGVGTKAAASAPPAQRLEMFGIIGKHSSYKDEVTAVFACYATSPSEIDEIHSD